MLNCIKNSFNSFSLLTFLLLMVIKNNVYAAVDMTYMSGRLNTSTYYHVEQRDLWKNENVYCIDPNRIVYEGDYKVYKSYEVDSKRGIYAANERQGIQAWILSMMVCLDILDMTWQQVHMNNI